MKIEVQRRRDIALERALRLFALDHHLSPEKMLGIEVAEHQSRVGDRRAIAALRIAGRSRHRAGAVRSHVQQTALVDPRDTAATRSDAAHVDGRETGHVTEVRRADPGLPGAGNPAPPHQAHVIARTPGIGNDRRVGLKLPTRVMVPRHRGHRRPGLDGMHGSVGERARFAHPTLGGDHQEPSAKPAPLQVLLKAAQIGAHERFQRRVDARRGCTPVLAQRRVYTVRKRVGHPGQLTLEQLPDALLVNRVGYRPQQTYPDCLDRLLSQLSDDVADRFLVQRRHDLAVRSNALGNLEVSARAT